MTNYDYVFPARIYVPPSPKYLYGNTETPKDDDFLGLKASSLGEKIKNLYEQLYQRQKVSKSLLSEVESELLETSSELFNNKYNPHLTSKQTSSLEKRIDLLEKTKRTELVDYWRDLFKLNIYLFQAKEDYKNVLAKRDLLK